MNNMWFLSKLFLLLKNIEININPFKIIIKRFFVALEDSWSFEKGAGCINPFNKSEDFNILMEFDKKWLNSLDPIIK